MINFLFKSIKSNHIKRARTFSTRVSVQEVTIPVPWGEIRGKWWGPTDKTPVLALHGWQDNCGSFDRLIPLLNRDIGYLAVDFPGHGYSSPIPAGIHYNISVYLLTIERIRRHFKWNQVSLLAHSLGGVSSFFYSMGCPDRVNFLACIDIHLPLLFKEQITWLKYSLVEFMKNNDHFMSEQEPPSYTINEIIKKIHQSQNCSISKEYAHYIMKRNIAPSKFHKGKYYFTRDPRLKGTEHHRFTMDDLLMYAKYLKCPIFLVKTVSDTGIQLNEQFYDVLPVLRENSRDLDFNIVDGTHHVHLNNPERLADFLNNFMQKHYDNDHGNVEIFKETLVSENQDPRIKHNFE